MQLNSTDSLRSALCIRLNRAFTAAAAVSQYGRSPSSALCLDSFARIAKPCRIFAMSFRVLTGHLKNVHSLALCSDGERLVSGSLDGTAKVWSVSRQQSLCTFSGHTGEVYCVAVSADGCWAASGSADKTVCIWTINDGAQKYKLSGHTDAIWGIAASADGRFVASGSGDKSINLWNPSNGQRVNTLRAHQDRVYSVAFTPDSETLVSGGADNRLIVWGARTGNVKRTISTNTATVKSLTLMSQGQHIVLGSRNKSIRVYNLDSGALEEQMAVEDHDDEVSCVAVFPVGQRVASSSHDTTVRINNMRIHEIELTLKGNDDFMWSVAVSADGRTLVSGGKSGMIKVWSLKFALDREG